MPSWSTLLARSKWEKHYGLRTHHLKRLIAFVEKSGTLQSHEDVPDDFREYLYMEEQHRLESQQSKSNKTVGTTGSCHPINIHFNGMSHSESPNSTAAPPMLPPPMDQGQGDFIIPGLRDEAVKEYSAWHKSNIADDKLKAQFRQACDIALANGFDLQLIYQDQDPSFFVDQGILVGIARQFIRDIMKWAKYVRSV
ncbi:hypothetical protein N7540_005817 [Penicillium herquei]|nr:hypothetical protein N7540_005817 [Penicillium herquei]